MPKPKSDISFSFKISNQLKALIEKECEIESRSQSDMAKLLIAEALMIREGKRNIGKVL